jgi:hypothetical protein
MSGAAVLAAEPLARTSEGMKSGPIGLAIVLLLCIACYFLFKSMSGHLRRVREDFPKNPPTGPGQAGPTPSAGDKQVEVKRVEPKRVEAKRVEAEPITPREDAGGST